MPTWTDITAANPAHSENYARRWAMMRAQGRDIDGEARLIDAMAERGSLIVDAGCGTGRVGGYLIERGHRVIGTDIDPVLIAHARRDAPRGSWYVADLTDDPIPTTEADLVVSAGNVMGFLPVDGRAAAIDHLRAALRPGGRAVIGFGAGRGWDFADFLDLCAERGFHRDGLFESWDLRPFTARSSFLVAVLSTPAESSPAESSVA